MTGARAELMALIHDVARLYRVASDKRARRHGMTRAQWIILIKLQKHPGMSQRELAAILEVEPITVARLIDRLEQLGMVERRADPKDRRIWRLHLLPPSKPVLAEIDEERGDLAGGVTAGMDDDAIRTMTEAMTDMRALLCLESRGKGRPDEDAAVPDAADGAVTRKVA